MIERYRTPARGRVRRLVVAAVLVGPLLVCACSGGGSDDDAIARVEASFGRCLAAAGASTDGAVVTDPPAGVGDGDTRMVTLDSGETFLVGVANTKGASVYGEPANDLLDRGESADPTCLD